MTSNSHAQVTMLTEEHKAELGRWLKAVHGDFVKPDVFEGPDRTALTVTDASGIIFFARLTLERNWTWRVDVQFMPREDPYRTARGMIAAVDYVVTEAQEKGIRNLIFDTRVPLLARLMERFGFQQVKDGSYVLLITKE